MIYLLGVLFAAVFGLGWYQIASAYEREAAIHIQMIATLEEERDAARDEAKIFRNLLFPAVARAENGELASAKAPPSQQSIPDTRPRLRRQGSWKNFFNEVRKLSNTPQQKTDALASALEKQKVPVSTTQEKTHVAS
jgi:hypothetical protein